MNDYTRTNSHTRDVFRALALVCSLGGVALAQGAGPLSPWSNCVDLAGRYMAPSPGGGGVDGLAYVNTQPSADNVLERSNGVNAQENTFTPFSDGFKKPMPQLDDLRGKSLSADIDLGSPSEWAGTTGEEAFVVGTGTTFGFAGPSGVVVEARYVWPTPTTPHAQFRLRTVLATGAWKDATDFGFYQVNGAYTVRIDVNLAGSQATMVVTPKPTLVPPPTGIYTDITDSLPASVYGPAPFVAGFWSSGNPGTVRGAARLVRMTTNAGDDMMMWLKSTVPYITSTFGQSIGATAPLTTEFHMGMSNIGQLARGFQASGIYYGNVYGYYINPMLMNPATIQDQSYTDPVVGPFPYLRSPYLFTTTLWDTIRAGSYGFANFRIAAGSPPGTPSLNTDAEVAGLPVGPVIPDPFFGMSGGVLSVQLTANDPEGILGVTGCAYEDGEVYAATIRGSDVVVVDEIQPLAVIDGGGVTQGTTNLIPFSGPNVTAYQGDVNVKFMARDQGDYGAFTGSGLGATPKAIVEVQTNSSQTGWAAAKDLTVFPSGENMFAATWTINNDTPCGTYRVRLMATDRVGLQNPSYVTRTFTVQTLRSVTVNLSLQGLVGSPSANNQRLIRFILGSTAGTTVPSGGSTSARTVIDKLVRFNLGQATVVFAPSEIPSCDARNLVIWAKDVQHTNATATAPQNGIVGSAYTANLVLRPGDVNNDNVINFTDYALFVADYGKVAPRDMTSMVWFRNSDLNGSGQVDFTDWTLFYPNYGIVGSAEPGDYVRAFAMTSGVNIHDPKLARMPVWQLVQLGASNAAKWDLNRDGWIDKSELDKALLTARFRVPVKGVR